MATGHFKIYLNVYLNPGLMMPATIGKAAGSDPRSLPAIGRDNGSVHLKYGWSRNGIRHDYAGEK